MAKRGSASPAQPEVGRAQPLPLGSQHQAGAVALKDQEFLVPLQLL